MTLQIGTILIAKEDIKMKDGSGVAIIKGNEYKIKDLILDVFIVKSELFDNHEFDIEDLDKYFTIKRYTLSDLQTRTDLMVRIENEEQAKKLGNKWYNTHYFSDELLYGHIKGVKEIIYLDADELEGRTLVPSIDLIDLEVKEEVKLVESHHVKQLESIDEIDLGDEGKGLTMEDFIEPIAMKAGDKRVLVNGLVLPVDFRIISEDNYKLLESEIARLKKENQQLRESTQISQSQQSEQTRMAWELYVSGFNHGVADKWTIDECFRTAKIFLGHAKSKEVKP